jgi:hypothetical protein
VLAELRTQPNWTPTLNGERHSPLSDGLFAGSGRVAGGGAVLLCCGRGSVADRLTNESRLSPTPGRRALVWQPYLWVSVDAFIPANPPARLYLVVSIEDDEEDGDGDGRVDANGTVVVRSEAIDPGGVNRAVEALVARRPIAGGGATAVGMLRWREIR